MVPEVVQPFWEAMQRGEFITDAAEGVGRYRKKGARWIVATAGMRLRRGRNLKGRCLSLAEREEMALGFASGESVRMIADRIGRSASTVSRDCAVTPTARAATGRPRRTHWPEIGRLVLGPRPTLYQALALQRLQLVERR